MYYTWLAFTPILEARSQRSRVWHQRGCAGDALHHTHSPCLCAWCASICPPGPGSDSPAGAAEVWGLFHQRGERWLWGEGQKHQQKNPRGAQCAVFALLAGFPELGVSVELQAHRIGDIVSTVVFPVVIVSPSLSAVALIVSQSVCSCSSCESVSACNYVGESVLACYTMSANGFP